MLKLHHIMPHNNPTESLNTINNKRSILIFISLVFLFLLSFNGASIFSVKIPSLPTTRKSRNLISVSSSPSPPPPPPPSSSSSPLMHTVKQQQQQPTSTPQLKLQSLPPTGAGDPSNFVSVPFFKHRLRRPQEPPATEENPYPDVNINQDAYLPHLRKSHSFEIESENEMNNRNKKLLKMLIGMGRRRDDFPARVKEFFSKKNNESSSCHVRFFMTWILSLNLFTERAFFSIESIFKTHPNGCLLIASTSLDSIKGRQILKPFTDKGFRVTAIAPDFSFLFRKTMAESWFTRLIRGHVRTGIIPLGQNISNLLRLCLLYKYGGVYIDTDVIILKSFKKLKNAIGAQSIDPNSKRWSRLNNAVMVFDKMHPLIYKFIEEFALTFNGNKWGHNGPYLVSRVVSRVQGRPGYDFKVLPPNAFYPMNWDRVRVLFREAKNETDSKWLMMKYKQIEEHSYALHLWNRQSRGFNIEEGSIVKKILLDHCVFCNVSSSDYTLTTSTQD